MDLVLVELIFEIAAFFSIFGFYYAIKAFISFKNMPDDLLRAKIFLTKNFLRNNFVFVFIMCFFVFLHTILEFFEYGFINILISFSRGAQLLYALTLPITTFVMAFLAYQWNNAIFSKK